MKMKVMAAKKILGKAREGKVEHLCPPGLPLSLEILPPSPLLFLSPSPTCNVYLFIALLLHRVNENSLLSPPHFFTCFLSLSPLLLFSLHPSSPQSAQSQQTYFCLHRQVGGKGRRDAIVARGK